jgi:hypothetical protein
VDYGWLLVALIVVVVVMGVVQRSTEPSGIGARKSLRRTNAGSSVFDRQARLDARRRIELETPAHIPDDGYTWIHVEKSWYADAVPVEYLATFELMLRGLAARLVIEPRLASLERQKKYTTRGLLPHLMDIDSIEGFMRVVPLEADLGQNLFVWNPDLRQAFAVLRELNVRLNIVRHPDQHWWKGEA